MKHILNLLFIFFILIGGTAVAQKDTSYIYLDSALNVIPKNKAVCVEKIYKKDGLWFVNVSYTHQPYLVMTGSYTDRELTTGEGWFEYYAKDSVIMNGSYHNGEQDGVWRKWATNGLMTDSVYFINGNVQAQAKYQYHANNSLWRYSVETAGNEKITRVYDTLNVLTSAGRFKDKDGEMFMYYPNGKVKTHSLFKNNERVLYEMFDDKGNKL